MVLLKASNPNVDIFSSIEYDSFTSSFRHGRRFGDVLYKFYMAKEYSTNERNFIRFPFSLVGRLIFDDGIISIISHWLPTE